MQSSLNEGPRVAPACAPAPRERPVGGVRRGVALLVLAFVLVGCTVRFAPVYDETIEADLVALHKDTERFFESLLADETRRRYDPCAGKAACSDEEKKAAAANEAFYVNTIAGLRSAQMRALRRKTPRSPLGRLLGGEDEAEPEATKAALEAAMRADENGCDPGKGNEIAQQLCLLLDSIIETRAQHRSANGLRAVVIEEARVLVSAHFGAIIDAEKTLKR